MYNITIKNCSNNHNPDYKSDSNKIVTISCATWLHQMQPQSEWIGFCLVPWPQISRVTLYHKKDAKLKYSNNMKQFFFIFNNFLIQRQTKSSSLTSGEMNIESHRGSTGHRTCSRHFFFSLGCIKSTWKQCQCNLQLSKKKQNSHI